jgi:Fe-S-cluster containining protein
MREVEQQALEALEAAPWFGDGLRFTCTGCGHCCTGASGAVYLSELDVQRLASKLQLSRDDFIARYTQWSDSELALIDKPDSPECVFLSGKACSVYGARPTQCRTYPFWLINVLESEDWVAEAHACEGINHPEAALIPVDTIFEQCRADLENEILPA